MEEVRQLMYQHDWSARGAMYFEDFLWVIDALDRQRREEVAKVATAFNRFTQKIGSTGLTRKQFSELLGAVNGFSSAEIDEALDLYFDPEPKPERKRRVGFLDEAGKPLPEPEPAAPSPSPSKLLNEEKFVKNSFSYLRLNQAEQDLAPLRSFMEIEVIAQDFHISECWDTRVKLRPGLCIEYESLDPVISLSLSGAETKTGVLSGLSPGEAASWTSANNLHVRWQFPVAEPIAVRRFVGRQHLWVHLWDRSSHEKISHLEWIASASAPISPILLSPSETVTLFLQAYAPTVVQPAHGAIANIRVTLKVTAKDFPNATLWQLGLPENVEDTWRTAFPYKMAADLRRGLSKSSVVDLHRRVWHRYNNLYQQLKHALPRRTWQFVSLTERNTFQYLCCFVRPLVSSPTARSSELIAYHVSRIQSSAMWSTSHVPSRQPPPDAAQIASPSLLLFRQQGQPLELAILLCDLFLGIDMNAYIAIGTAYGVKHYWVITLEKQAASTVSRCGHVQKTDVPTLADNPANRGFQQELFTVNQAAEDRVWFIRHWEPATGMWYSVPTAPEFPFSRVGCLFNHRNIYVNKQRHDLTSRMRFDTSLSADWIPLLTPELEEVCCPVQCWYESPSALFEPTTPSVHAYTRSFVSEFVERIYSYRRDVLNVSDTKFHRLVSSILQALYFHPIYQHCSRMSCIFVKNT